jgi:hypothetical protein
MLKYSIVHVGNVVCVFLYTHEDILNKIQNEMKNIYEYCGIGKYNTNKIR